MKEIINKYCEYRQKIRSYSYALTFLSWDSSTVAPKGCFADRSNYIGVLVEEQLKIVKSKEYQDIVTTLYNNLNLLDEDLAFEIKRVKESNDKNNKIPTEEQVEYEKLTSLSQDVWVKAKTENDFSIFKPALEKIIDFKKKYCEYVKTDKLQGYDCLLDDYEEGLTQVECDKFFDTLKEKLVPFVRTVLAKKVNFKDKFLTDYFPVEKQKEVVQYIKDVMEYDMDRGAIMETEHPFTSGVNNNDVRITIHYYPEMMTSSIFSAIHELGHATYEQQVDSKYNNTSLSGGCSMALHESQSRFYENIVGRSHEFWETHYPKLQEIYGDYLKDYTLEDFYKGINKVEASYIRTEADELTYPLHIMLRYELEKKLINGSISVENIEQEWNKLFKEYFGIEVDCPKNGVLQDVHWSSGLVGYFPTYALGSAYASQIYNAMKKDFDVSEALKEKTTGKINKWLKEHIHQYGASKYPQDILKMATGEEFNPQYYIDYLIEKYKKIYEL